MTAKWWVGQRVKVFDINGRRRGDPPDGLDGEVVKVGRKLFHVQYGRRTEVFRMDTGKANDDYGHRWVLTVDEAAEREERASLHKQIMAHKVIEFRLGSRPSLTLLRRLADLLDEEMRDTP